MSYAIDANVLLHAANRDSPSHRVARAFLDACAEREETLCLTWDVVFAFLRISTHIGVFKTPLAPREAMDAIDELLDLPQTRLLVEDLGFWKSYRSMADSLTPRGKAVPDTHLAALLLFHGVRVLHTTDTDFRRYDGLKPRGLER